MEKIDKKNNFQLSYGKDRYNYSSNRVGFDQNPKYIRLNAININARNIRINSIASGGKSASIVPERKNRNHPRPIINDLRTSRLGKSRFLNFPARKKNPILSMDRILSKLIAATILETLV